MGIEHHAGVVATVTDWFTKKRGFEVHRFAVLSDVNANLEALSAVLRDVEAQGISDVLFLGDAVGYGPDPVECVARLRETVRVYLSGRLEFVMTHATESDLIPLQQEIQLSHDVLRSIPSVWEWLRNRPTVYSDGEMLAVHSNPRGRQYECLILENIQLNPHIATSTFSLFKTFLFVGDNHQPWIFTEDNQLYTEKDLNYAYRLSGGDKKIVSVGSVGQPRDGDPRACYVVASSESIAWRRVEYDIERTVSKIEAIPSLAKQFAMRLREGI